MSEMSTAPSQAMLLSIEHTTIYDYSEPVQLSPHRLMVRPLDGHDVQIRSSKLAIQPGHRVRWIHDLFGNSIALVEFTEPAAQLRVESRVRVEQFNANPLDFVLESQANEIPFAYRDDEARDVAPYLHRQHPEDEAAIRSWIRPFLDLHGRAKTMDFLIALNKSVPLYFQYARREEPGVQTLAQTLRQRSGSCRDFALLLMETARHLGMAARFVSGYLCNSSNEWQAAASGATHAWAEIYLPGAGWKGFDPTCGILAGNYHVRVAVVREPSQAVPVSGGYRGSPSAFQRLQVIVKAQVAETKVVS